MVRLTIRTGIAAVAVVVAAALAQPTAMRGIAAVPAAVAAPAAALVTADVVTDVAATQVQSPAVRTATAGAPSAATSTVPAGVPARIVSTSPSVTETLFALGLGDRVVGVSSYCRYPAEVTKLPKVGTFLRPNAEAIARLTPDLVFVHTGPNATASQLATLGIKTALVDRGTLDSVFTSIRDIGAAAGVPDRAERLLADVHASLDRVKASVAGRARRKVLIVVGRRTGTLTDIVGVGPGSYLHDVAAIAGGTNVLSNVTVAYPRISLETVIALAPDVIVDIGEMGESPADSEQRRRTTESLWQRQTLVKAVRDAVVHATNDEAFVVPGLRIVDVARTMASWFHGVGASGRPGSRDIGDSARWRAVGTVDAGAVRDTRGKCWRGAAALESRRHERRRASSASAWCGGPTDTRPPAHSCVRDVARASGGAGSRSRSFSVPGTMTVISGPPARVRAPEPSAQYIGRSAAPSRASR